jgi:hypothetical protein
MLHQTLPGVPEAVDDARAWVRTAVLAQHPNIPVAHAVQVVGDLVAEAIKHTPDGSVVEVRLIPCDNGLVIEVTDPNSPPSPHDGTWGDVSRLVKHFGTSTSTDGGHTAWCELSEVPA